MTSIPDRIASFEDMVLKADVEDIDIRDLILSILLLARCVYDVSVEVFNHE